MPKPPCSGVRAFYRIAPFLSNGEKIDFVGLIATLPGRHSGDHVHKVKKKCRAIALYLTVSGDKLDGQGRVLRPEEARVEERPPPTVRVSYHPRLRA